MLEALVEFMGIFFGLPARLAARPARCRRSGTALWDTGSGPKPQYQTGVLLDKVLAPRLPDDAVACLGVTMADLFPSAAWNYVFGEASFERRVGIYSLVRYTPEFEGEPDSPAARGLLLRRSCKALAHETGHMFSMRHCPVLRVHDERLEHPRRAGPRARLVLPGLPQEAALERGLRPGRSLPQAGRLLPAPRLADWAAWMDARYAMLQPMFASR